MSETKILDLRGIPCPKNAAKACLMLAGMSTGQELEIILDNGEPLENVPSALEGEGHTIVKTWTLNEGATCLLVVAG